MSATKRELLRVEENRTSTVSDCLSPGWLVTRRGGIKALPFEPLNPNAETMPRCERRAPGRASQGRQAE